MSDIRNLHPQSMWNHFADLNAVPRASKKEERVIEFMKSFGENLGLDTKVDEVGNIIIKKPATADMVNKPTIVMQSHVDMVHQKNNDTDFDFDTQGIEMYIDGDWVKANGTTLGADNGIGVASIMAILASDDISHPAIEALFTIDEETGMTGAIGLKAGELTGKYLLNLDTEEDNELTIGCAGGVDTTSSYAYGSEPLEGEAYEIVVKGLNGGHSGMDINKELGNANRILNRLVYTLGNLVRYVEFDGGGLRNAIPREAHAVVSVLNKEAFMKNLVEFRRAVQQEYRSVEPNLTIEVVAVQGYQNQLVLKDHYIAVTTIAALPNGVYRMSTDVPGLVETSTNLARVLIKDGEFVTMSLQRSNVETRKVELLQVIDAVFALAGIECTHTGDYPGWEPQPGSELVNMMSAKYTEMFNEKADVNACHAGLECGILGSHYPEMEMISFGPTIRGAHSPDERVSISSVEKYWKYLLEVLKNIPDA